MTQNRSQRLLPITSL